MKKAIFVLGLMVTLASCGAGAAKEEAPKADSTAVAVAVDSAMVDTAKVTVETTTAVATTTAK